MILLGVTSRDVSVKSMGGRSWQRLHRSVYLALPIILLHSVFVGADFGVNRGPDVQGEADVGALIGFLCLSAAWIALMLLRRRGVKWTPKFFKRASAPSESVARTES